MKGLRRAAFMSKDHNSENIFNLQPLPESC